jgi:hypothetical protein
MNFTTSPSEIAKQAEEEKIDFENLVSDLTGLVSHYGYHETSKALEVIRQELENDWEEKIKVENI